LPGLSLAGLLLVGGAAVAQEMPAVNLGVIGPDGAVAEPVEPVAPEGALPDDPSSPVVRIEAPAQPDASAAVPEPIVPAENVQPVQPVEPVVPGQPLEAGAEVLPIAPLVPAAQPVPPIVPPAQSNAVDELGRDLDRLRQQLADRQLAVEARERQVAALEAALITQMAEIQAMQANIERRWVEADSAWQAAHATLVEAEQGCVEVAPATPAIAGGVLGAPGTSLQVGVPADEQAKRVEQVVSIIKAMDPDAAARVIQSWDDTMASMALQRLPARVASKVVASLPPEHAARLTAGMIRGGIEGAMP
jgi:flagellar motility protein MotE (MotC chaperone)